MVVDSNMSGALERKRCCFCEGLLASSSAICNTHDQQITIESVQDRMILAATGRHVAVYPRERIIMFGRLPMGRSIRTGHYHTAVLLSEVALMKLPGLMLTATDLLLPISSCPHPVSRCYYRIQSVFQFQDTQLMINIRDALSFVVGPKLLC